MKAVIEITVKELNNALVDRIKSLFAGKEEARLTISFDGADASYLDVLYRSQKDLENNRNLITFTMEELEVYGNSKKP